MSFLALQPAGRATRERIRGLLWSDRGEEQAQNSLRTELGELRRAWAERAPGLLRSDHTHVGLDLSCVSVDALRAEALIDRESDDLTELARLWKGELLADVAAPDRSFDEWLMIERAHRGRRLERAVAAGLDRAEQRGDDAGVVALAEALLRQDPTRERPVRALMQLDIRRGDAAPALRRYAAFRETLSRELDIQPSPELDALQAAARRLATTRAQRPVILRPMVRRLPRLVVAFRPPIGPPQAASELNGLLQEELLLCLARARHLAVSARPETGVVAEDADYALFVLLSFNGLSGRVTARLTRQPDGQLMVGQQFDLRDSDLHAVIAIEAERVAFAVEHAIGMQRRPSVADEPDAYGLWLAGDRLQDTFQAENLDAAVLLFKRAAAADPLFAKPIAGLASIELSLPMVRPTASSHEEHTERGLRLVKQAIALDPWDAPARVVLAWAYLKKRLPRFALVEFHKALALNPQDPDVLIACAEGLSYLGDTNTSMRSGEKALMVHGAPPDYYHYYLSVAYAHAGALDLAADHNLAVSATFPEQLAWRTMILHRLGRPKEARAAMDLLVSHLGDKMEGGQGFDRSSLFCWLNETILIPDHGKRDEFVATISELC